MEKHHIHIKPAMFFLLAIIKGMLSEFDEKDREGLTQSAVFFLMDK